MVASFKTLSPGLRDLHTYILYIHIYVPPFSKEHPGQTSYVPNNCELGKAAIANGTACPIQSNSNIKLNVS